MSQHSNTRSRFFRFTAVGAILALSRMYSVADYGEDPQGYLTFRGQDTNPASKVHDAWGLSLGRNWNEHWGAELAVDNYEIFPEPPNSYAIGEYAAWSFMPLVRFRYPLYHGRLVPYAIVGGGYAFTQFNDAKQPSFGQTVETPSGTTMGAVGAGIEYFVHDNLALGIEFKYLLAESQTFHVGGNTYRQDINAPLLTLSLRIHPFESHAHPLATESDRGETRFYLGLRAGFSRPTAREALTGIRNHHEPPAYLGTLNQQFGGVIGLDFHRPWGFELSADIVETVLQAPGYGNISEYATYPILANLRLRWERPGSRWVPYGIVGAGFASHEANDRKPPGNGLVISESRLGPAVDVGGGIEYFVAHNFSLGVDLRHIWSWGHTLRINNGPNLKGNANTLLGAFAARIYFGGK